MDLYTEISRYYDSENMSLIEDFSAYELLVERFGGPVLDVGCGTGRITLHLAGQGVEIVGLDSSQSMLDKARVHEQDRKQSVKWVLGDMREVELDQKFGLAIFSFSGFMHLLEHSDQIKTLQRIAHHLKAGGGIALDLASPIETFRADDSDSMIVERIFIDADTGDTVIQQSLATMDRVRQTMSLTWIYDRMGKDGQVYRSLVPQLVRYTFASEMRLLLQLAGFEQIEIYGDYEFNTYSEDSPRLFAVATKPSGAG